MARTRRKRKLESIQAQDSPLLNLHPEVRNMIYTLVAHGEKTYAFRDGTVAQYRICEPALARTCRQLQAEYTGVYEAEGHRFASHFVIHLANFDARHLEKRLHSFSPSTDRKIQWKMTVDNFWTDYTARLRDWSNMLDRHSPYQSIEILRGYPLCLPEIYGTTSEIEISINRTGFAFDFCRQHLKKLDLPDSILVAFVEALGWDVVNWKQELERWKRSA
ncbi:hypothetical protein B0A50_08247 [Salinomyces thailandicus]|uniref:Uncharacterized protein n=1 Tax=Salinomyces thailandicus TaxID=706561 RepID=A0A4U0TKX3_9PEZI|nr:hypothetical protein B0A50_08247 [Salinomyces thailandica]